MDFDFTDEQRMLRDSVVALCESEQTLSALRRSEQTGAGFPRNVWEALASAGYAGVFVPEEYGGIALGNVGAAILYEEMGRHLAITPHFVSGFLAASLISRCGSEKLKAEWLPAIASGDRVVTVAVEEPTRTSTPEGFLVEARETAGRLVLSGVKHLVPYVDEADALLVLAKCADKGTTGVYLVPRNVEGITCEFQSSLANDGLYRITFDKVAVSSDQVVATDIWEAWEELLDAGGTFIAAFASGAAQAVLDMSSTYAKERVQFGKPIGAFQVIAHMLADMSTEIEAARTMAYYAAWKSDAGLNNQVESNQAKLVATTTLRNATAAAIQIHGGFGFTLEGNPQLFFRRAKHLQLFFRDAGAVEDRIADLLLGKVAASNDRN